MSQAKTRSSPNTHTCASGQRKWSSCSRRFSRVLPRELDVLDVGCGPGTWALQLAPQVKSVHGLDIAPAFIAHASQSAAAKGTQNASFEVASFMEYETERRFGLVILGAMLVYINDQDLVPFFSKVRRFLAPGGVGVRANLRRPAAVPIRGKAAIKASTAPAHSTKRRSPRLGLPSRANATSPIPMRSLAAVYFGAANLATLGALRRFEGVGARWYDVLEQRRSIAFDRARWWLDLTPAPVCYHFFLTPTR